MYQTMNQIRQKLNQVSQIAQQLQQIESSNQQMALQAQQNPQAVSSVQMGSFASSEANATQKLRQVNQLVQEIVHDLNQIQAQTQQFQQGQQPSFIPSNAGIQGFQPQGLQQQGNIYQQLKQQTQPGYSTTIGQGQPFAQSTQNQSGYGQQGNIYQQVKQQTQATGQPGTGGPAWGQAQQAHIGMAQQAGNYGQAQGNIYQRLKQQTSSTANVANVGASNIYRGLKQQTARPATSGKIGFHPSIS